ncbi:unnamed protein product, partial [Chrysoparadoxa australica]
MRESAALSVLRSLGVRGSAPQLSGSPYASMSHPSTERVRGDGRKSNQIRPMSSEQGLLHQADGSVTFSAGDTLVLVAVYGPAQAKSSRKEDPSHAVIEVSLRPVSGMLTAADAQKQLLIQKSLERALLLTKYPRTIISVIVQVLADDGGLLSCAINASAIALMDAGIEMTAVPLGMSSCLGPGRIVRLDPTKEEEQSAEALVCLSGLSTEEGILACQTRGMLSGNLGAALLVLLLLSAPIPTVGNNCLSTSNSACYVKAFSSPTAPSFLLSLASSPLPAAEEEYFACIEAATRGA